MSARRGPARGVAPVRRDPRDRSAPVRADADSVAGTCAAGPCLPAGAFPRVRERAGAGTGMQRHPDCSDAARNADAPGVTVLRSAGASRGACRTVRTSAPPCRQGGFTLIEILLATTLLALGLALAFATLRASTATVERGEAIAARSERMRAVDGFLRRRLASATPIAFAIDEDSGRMVRFIGEPERMRFVADLPDYLGRGGPHLHDVAVLDAGDGARLAVSFAMVASGATIEDPDARPPETLVPDLAQARFRYRGLGEDGLLGEWTDTWEQVDMLPLQVSVELASRGGGTWPPVVVMLPQRMGGVVP